MVSWLFTGAGLYCAVPALVSTSPLQNFKFILTIYIESGPSSPSIFILCCTHITFTTTTEKKAIQRWVLLFYLRSRQPSYEAIGLQTAKGLYASSRGQLNERRKVPPKHVPVPKLLSFLSTSLWWQRTCAPDNAGLMPRPKPDDSHLEM